MEIKYLFAVIFAVLVVLKLIKATAKVMVSAAIITAIVYILMYLFWRRKNQPWLTFVFDKMAPSPSLLKSADKVNLSLELGFWYNLLREESWSLPPKHSTAACVGAESLRLTPRQTFALNA